jgi:hypothetical protein
MSQNNPLVLVGFYQNLYHRASKAEFSRSHSHIIRTTSAGHSRVITAFDTRFITRLLRVCRPFMYCRCLALLARRKCAGPWVTFGQYCIYDVTAFKFVYGEHSKTRLNVLEVRMCTNFGNLGFEFWNPFDVRDIDSTVPGRILWTGPLRFLTWHHHFTY